MLLLSARSLIRSSALLAVAVFVAASATPVAAEFISVDISNQFNGNLRGASGGAQYPIAPTTIDVGGTPFDLKPLANTADSLGIVGTSNGPFSFVFPVNQPDAVAVYTLINSGFGSFGANNGTVEAIGSAGAFASFDLIQGTNIRDHFQNVFNNIVGPEIQSAIYGSVRLDRQVLLLPASFQGQTLTEIRLRGTGGNPSGIPFVAAITVLDLLLGDMNADGAVDNEDIQPFVALLVDPPSYTALTGISEADGVRRGDIDRDGSFDNVDIQPFVSLLVGGAGSSVPEPSGGLLMILGALLAMAAPRATRLRRQRQASR